MNHECIQPTISRQQLKPFAFTAFDTVSVEKLGRVFSSASLPPAVDETSSIDQLDGFYGASVFTHLQQAM